MPVQKRFFLDGGVKVEICGMDRERFFNIAAQRELKICEICECREKNGERRIFFWTTVPDFRKMKPVAKKVHVSLWIRKKYGLPFFLYKNRRRKLLAAGFLSFFLILYGLSFFIWDISFEGNQKFTDEMLLHYMETLPVACGMRKADVSCEKLEGELRNHFAEITWVSAEITGTRLIVRIKENEVLLAPKESDPAPCDLAASKDGVVERVVVRSGFSQVKAGDEVEAGQLLVSGTIPIYDDSENLVNSHEIHADAEIYARTMYRFQKSLPSSRTEKARNGKERKGLFAEFFGHTFYFLMPDYGKSENWEFVMTERQLKLFEDFYLPAYVGLITAYEYVPYEKVYTKEEAEAAGSVILAEYMENLTEKGIQMIGNDVKIEKSESGWQIYGTLSVVENIAEEVPIPEKYEENQTVDERNRDDN